MIFTSNESKSRIQITEEANFCEILKKLEKVSLQKKIIQYFFGETFWNFLVSFWKKMLGIGLLLNVSHLIN